MARERNIDGDDARTLIRILEQADRALRCVRCGLDIADHVESRCLFLPTKYMPTGDAPAPEVIEV